MASQLGPVLNKGLRMRLSIIGLHKLYTLSLRLRFASPWIRSFKVIVLSSIGDKISRVLEHVPTWLFYPS